MAYTNTPLQNTEQSKPIALMREWNSRNGTTNFDSDALNVVFEPVVNQLTGDQYFEAMKRDGNVQWAGGDRIIYASFLWAVANLYITIVRKDVGTGTGSLVNAYYSAGPNEGTLAWQLIIGGTVPWQGQFGFSEYQYADGTQALILFTQQFGFVISPAGSSTPIAFPVGFGLRIVPFPVVMDGYLFAATPMGRVYNSKLNDPTDFTNAEWLTAENYPDGVSGLARMGNYIVVMGDSSIQYFYNAAREVGTPLEKNPQVIRMGYQGGLCNYGDSLLFVGTQNGRDVSVWMLTEFSLKEIGGPQFSRWYSTFRAPVGALTATNRRWTGNLLLLNGHTVYIPSYVFTSNANPIGPEPPLPQQPYDFAYGVDILTGLWTRLVFGAGLVMSITGYGADKYTVFGQTVIYQTRRNLGTDNGVIFSVAFTTPTEDLSTHRNKFGRRIVMWADQSPVPTYSLISWTKDDYQTFSGPRAVDMSHSYQQLFQLGKFRKIAFRVTYDSAYPMRWKLMELDYEVGQA